MRCVITIVEEGVAAAEYRVRHLHLVDRRAVVHKIVDHPREPGAREPAEQLRVLPGDAERVGRGRARELGALPLAVGEDGADEIVERNPRNPLHAVVVDENRHVEATQKLIHNQAADHAEGEEREVLAQHHGCLVFGAE